MLMHFVKPVDEFVNFVLHASCGFVFSIIYNLKYIRYELWVHLKQKKIQIWNFFFYVICENKSGDVFLKDV